MNEPCPLCGRPSQPLFRLFRSPRLQNVLHDSRETALAAPRGDCSFALCTWCHHGFNPEFRAEEVEYDPSYDNDQTASDRYREHVEWVASQMAERCSLGAHSRILEIGCGNGYLLSRLEARTGARATGFDPSYDGRFGDPNRIHRKYFRPSPGESWDLVVLRHCLDAFTDPDAILDALVPALGRHGHLYVESADLGHILRHAEFPLLYHEYARYFSVTSLSVYLGTKGLVLESATPCFGGQYFSCIFRPAAGPERIQEAPSRIRKALDGSRRILVWGISGRAITILTHLDLGTDIVAHGVDIAPAKQGRFIPVTGQSILSPKQAVEFGPDLVVIPNRLYEHEIRPLFPPSTRFLTFEEALA